MAKQDKSVYVRRRIIVLLGVIAVALAVVLIIIRPGSSGGAKGVEKVEVPADLTEKVVKPTGKPAENPACELAQLKVQAITDQASYGAGEFPQLSLSVENTGDEACIAELGTAGMTFTVSSGSDQVWRSTDCQKAPESLPVILEAGEVLESEAINWDRTRSSVETCEIPRDPVVGGGASYHLTVGAAGVEGKETAQFLLY